jgi:uncharacterized protein GlcG (DUF336 family)
VPINRQLFVGWMALRKLLYTKTNVVVFYLLYRSSYRNTRKNFPNNKIRTAPMSALTLKVAVSLASKAIAFGREIGAAPLTIAVLDAGGHLVALQREDGASLLRPQIAIGKAWGAIALGKGSRLLALDAQQRPAFIAALNSLGQGSVVPAPGGVLIRDQAGHVLGAIGISGDLSDVDEQVAIQAVEAVDLQADAGVAA